MGERWASILAAVPLPAWHFHVQYMYLDSCMHTYFIRISLCEPGVFKEVKERSGMSEGHVAFLVPRPGGIACISIDAHINLSSVCKGSRL